MPRTLTTSLQGWSDSISCCSQLGIFYFGDSRTWTYATYTTKPTLRLLFRVNSSLRREVVWQTLAAKGFHGACASALQLNKLRDFFWTEKYSQRIPRQSGSFSIEWRCVGETCRQFRQFWRQKTEEDLETSAKNSWQKPPTNLFWNNSHLPQKPQETGRQM